MKMWTSKTERWPEYDVREDPRDLEGIMPKQVDLTEEQLAAYRKAAEAWFTWQILIEELRDGD